MTRELDRTTLRSMVEVAARKMRAAEQLETPAERLRLGREATVALIASFSLAEAPALAASESVEQALLGVAALPEARAHRDAIAWFAGKAGSPMGDQAAFERLADLFAWLEARIDTHLPRELLLTRWLAGTSAAALLLGCFWFLFSPRNLARGKSVRASSTCNFTPPPPLGKPALYRVVDGRENEATFAVCTNMQRAPWVEVDLGQSQIVNRVIVYPRNDCCYGENELPISLQLSTDGVHFDEIDTRNSPATVEFPWRFTAKERRARFVRIGSLAREKRQVVLGEVEVYGG